MRGPWSAIDNFDPYYERSIKEEGIEDLYTRSVMSARREFLRKLSVTLAGLGMAVPFSLTGGRGTLSDVATVHAVSMRQLRHRCGGRGEVALLERYYPGVEGGGGLLVWHKDNPYGRGADGGLVVPACDGGWWVRPKREAVHAMWFGVGLRGGDDTAAMQRACDAVHDGGTLRLKGEITLSDAVTLFGRSVTVEAAGATITMAKGGGYHAFILGGKQERVERVTWSGGTVDGNKAKQSWTDETTGVSHGTGVLEKSRLPNHGLLTIRDTEYASFIGVTVRRNVMSGLQHLNAGEGVTRNCVGAEAGDPKGVYPGTFSSRNGRLGLFEDCRAEGGNIGFVYTSAQVPPGSRFIVRGCTVKNTGQGAYWCEKSEEFLLEDFRAETTDPRAHNVKVHVNNSVRRTHIRRGVIMGSRIDFNNASKHEAGTVEDVRVIGYQGKGAAIHNASKTSRCTVLNSAGHGIRAKISEDDIVDGFTGRGIEWADEVIRPTVHEGKIGIFNPGRVVEGVISEVEIGVRQTSGETVLSGIEISNTYGPAISSRDTAERLVVRECILRDFGRVQGTRLGVEAGTPQVEIVDTRFELTTSTGNEGAQAYRSSNRQARLIFTRNTLVGLEMKNMLQHAANEAIIEGNTVQR